jgi:hypothetical protein
MARQCVVFNGTVSRVTELGDGNRKPLLLSLARPVIAFLHASLSSFPGSQFLPAELDILPAPGLSPSNS